ncbi:cyclic nucleotide-binding and patatin-like phospholipase domain-containing protein [Paucibacter sp. DJ2R-2]|uniref:cyclic nucleotide-binding and patatin-like phospholipase domain-containing protein n=1 Tax=Paucibacter sp. DJ2R-2 TaxID=2893558 RepID=UPI0021E4FD98|nr:cyclic nucleotide-binding and patatin-like phospholipase domain-containing protein [Paucibacter sp. DJ2R-2]MCV2423160.1 patatin-like phospholipase family protein [Paucibacter sp. DJ4R-1]MCV2440616.1 patatin-like phospholipase family protein [Paucibacter sp. DJ2R-2]
MEFQPEHIHREASLAKVLAMLQASPVFGGLPAGILKELAEAMEVQQVQGGATLLREGEASDTIIFVISGGLRVTRRDATGQRLLYNQVQPGQSIGELGLILQQARAQDLSAVRDSRLAVLSRQAYQRLLQRHPTELCQVFVQAVYERLRPQHEVPVPQRMAQTFALLPLQRELDQDGCGTALAEDLCRCLSLQGRSGHLREVRDPASGAPQLLLNGQALPHEALAHLEDRFDFIVYQARHADDLGAEPEAWTRFALRQADQLILLSGAHAPHTPSRVEQALLAGDGNAALKRQHLVLLHDAHEAQPVLPTPWLMGRTLERIYPLRRARLGDTQRLARFLTGSALGLVLGGGGARGFAHLGVLRALQESQLPVDLIGGNSMGALIAAQYACGHSLEQILSQTRRFAAGGERLTLPLVSLVAGRRVERDLRRMFGERLIEQLWLPFFAAACNLSEGTTSTLDQGPLWRAVLASNSPAGLFPPVLQGGALLVDGAILDNVPVQAMRVRLGTPLERRRGNGSIIAVDVDVRASLRADSGLARLGNWQVLKRWLRPGAPAAPGIADILYSAGHIGSLGQRQRARAQADHYLEPPVAGFALMAYAQGAEIAELGYRHAMEHIEQWDRKQLLNLKPKI